jgi:hypothetical protein
MGRPIKAKYFVKGGAKDPSKAILFKGVTVAMNNTGSNYSAGTTAVVSAPNATSGLAVQATVALSINTGTLGNLAVSVVNPGAGYNVNPTVTITTATAQSAVISTNTTVALTVPLTSLVYPGMRVVGTGVAAQTYVTSITSYASTSSVGVSQAVTGNLSGNTVQFIDSGTSATFTIGLTAAENDVGIIACSAFLLVANGGSSAVASSIIEQKGARSYLVENGQGRGGCKLTQTTSAPVAGQLRITAQDANGSTYVVTHLTSRKCRLKRLSMNGSYAFADGTMARWKAGFANASGAVSTAVGACVGIQTY